MNERDKLGNLLFTLPVSDRAADTAPEIMVLCDEAAEAILEAGYREPRTLTTAEELKALPDLSIILDDMSGPLVKSGGWWQGRSVDLRVNQVILPATVIYDPEAQA